MLTDSSFPLIAEKFPAFSERLHADLRTKWLFRDAFPEEEDDGLLYLTLLAQRVVEAISEKNTNKTISVVAETIGWLQAFDPSALETAAAERLSPNPGPIPHSLDMEWEFIGRSLEPYLRSVYQNRHDDLARATLLMSNNSRNLVSWESGVNPYAPPKSALHPRTRALFWLDSRNYHSKAHTWKPTEQSSLADVEIRAVEKWPRISQNAVSLHPGSGLSISFTLPYLSPNKDLLVLALVQPKVGRGSSTFIDTPFAELSTERGELRDKSWKLSSLYLDNPLTFPLTETASVVGFRVSADKITLVTPEPQVATISPPHTILKRDQRVRLVLGPQFTGKVWSVAAYATLADNSSIINRVDGLLDEYRTHLKDAS